MKKEVKIKTEYKPERCEICHQSDYFNPINNHCSRCSNINIEKIKQDKVVRNNITESSIIDDWILCSTDKEGKFKRGILYMFYSIFLTGFFTISVITGSLAYIPLLAIFATVIASLAGITQLLDWYSLRKDENVFLQEYRPIISFFYIVSLIMACIIAQIIMGKPDILISSLAIAYIAILFKKYFNLYQTLLRDNKYIKE